jgi:drug/metabolite transporter (DMT)-like permease
LSLPLKRTQVGIAATLMATTPILVIPLVVLSQGYRPTVRALLGTSAAGLGVALLFSH